MASIATCRAFQAKYAGVTSERQYDQNFIRDFVSIFTDEDPSSAFRFQYPVPGATKKGNTGFIDALWEGHVLIEMKSTGEDLGKALKDQVRDYIGALPGGVQPKMKVVSDFQSFLVEDPNGELHRFPLSELEQNLHLFERIFDGLAQYLRSNGTVNQQAANLLANVLNGIRDGYPVEHLPVLATRLLFVLYADDNHIFNQSGAFHEMVQQSDPDGKHLGRKINGVFALLDDKGADDSEYRYINGEVFTERIPAATFDADSRRALLEACEYDWRGLDPMIFGTIYQSAMDAGERHAEGAHYTHEQDIQDILGPAFLNELRERYAKVKESPKMLDAFLHDLSQVHVLDPACGSGNFLLVAYRELRALETAGILAMQGLTRKTPPSRIALSQMHGIEYNPLSAAIARASLWLALDAADRAHADAVGELTLGTFPLHQHADIRYANAATTDWATAFPGMTAIVGNPPYINNHAQNDMQRMEVKSAGIRGAMDYAHIWIIKGAEYIAANPDAMVGYVITDSVAQGEQVRNLWSHPAMKSVYVRFGRQSYVWPGDALVRVINVGLGSKPEAIELKSEDGAPITTDHISPYMVPSPVPTRGAASSSRTAPEWMVQIGRGYSYYDGDKKAGEYPYSQLSDADLAAIRRDHPEMLVRKISASNLLDGTDDWVLWWEHATPAARKHPVIKRLRARAADIRARGKSLAKVPDLERPEWFPKKATVDGPTMVVPSAFSKEYAVTPVAVLDGRHYITQQGYYAPLDWFMVGLVMSKQAMDAQRAAGGKIGKGGDIRYNTGLLYGMPAPANDTPDLREKIAAKAQECVEARPAPAADCMKNSNMPPALARLHAELDALVAEWWGC